MQDKLQSIRIWERNPRNPSGINNNFSEFNLTYPIRKRRSLRCRNWHRWRARRRPDCADIYLPSGSRSSWPGESTATGWWTSCTANCSHYRRAASNPHWLWLPHRPVRCRIRRVYPSVAPWMLASRMRRTDACAIYSAGIVISYVRWETNLNVAMWITFRLGNVRFYAAPRDTIRHWNEINRTR